MNCKNFRKYVGAFADGELEVSQNLQALEHLNMCPSCASRVNNINELKAALGLAYKGIKAPAGLETRIRDAIKAQPAAMGATKDVEPTSNTTWFGQKSWAPLGMAAALFIVAGIWWSWPEFTPRQGSITVVTGQTVTDIRQQHDRCLYGRGLAHHASDLPRSLVGIRQILSKELKLKVLAPDLSNYGYQLVGADRCGIVGRPGAHVMYRTSDGDSTLSLFSVAHLDFLITSSKSDGGQTPYFVSEQNKSTVLAWHDGAQTYVVCGNRPPYSLQLIFNEVRIASAQEIHILGLPQTLLASVISP